VLNVLELLEMCWNRREKYNLGKWWLLFTRDSHFRQAL